MPPVSVFSSHFVLWWKFNYSVRAPLRGKRAPRICWYPLIERFTSWKNGYRRPVSRSSGTRRYEEFVRQLDLHFYEHWGVLWRIQWFMRAACRRGAAREGWCEGCARRGAAGGGGALLADTASIARRAPSGPPAAASLHLR